MGLALGDVITWSPPIQSKLTAEMKQMALDRVVCFLGVNRLPGFVDRVVRFDFRSPRRLS